MSPQGILKWLFGLALAALFAGGVWLRVTSLQTAPLPTGDEAIYGVQEVRLLQGKSVNIWTPSRHLLSPVLAALQLPMVLAFEPSYTSLRLPVALVGILTIALMYVLIARVIDRPTALIASTLLAVLPIAIIYSRIAWEPGLVPLWSLLLVWLAFRRSRVALPLALLFGVFFVSLTLLMLTPMLWSVLTAKALADPEKSRRERWKSVLVTTATLAALVVPVALLCRDGRAAEWTRATYGFGGPDLGRFLSLYEKMLMGFCMGVPTATGRSFDLAFWGFVAAVLVLGSWRLAVERRWDRLALVGSLILSIIGLNRLEGPDVLQPGLVRYGIFLVVPSVLAFACLARSLLIVRPALRNLQITLLLLLGFLTLFGAKRTWFDPFVVESGGVENLWTLRSESDEQKHTITRILLDDMTAARPTPSHLILAEDHWSSRPIQFFTAWRRDVKVIDLESLPETERGRIVREQVKTGAYVVGVRDAAIDRAVRSSFAPDELRHWDVAAGYNPVYRVYRR